MVKYIIKRILIFIPTIIAISLITFVISINSPGDPVERFMGISEEASDQTPDHKEMRVEIEKLRAQMGLDLPVFYFTLSKLATPDTLHRIHGKFRRENLLRLIAENGNWPQIETYFHSINTLAISTDKLPGGSPYDNRLILLKRDVNLLFHNYKDKRILELLSIISDRVNNDLYFKSIYGDLQSVKESFSELQGATSSWKNYIPTLHFHGLNNQYHNWIAKFITGDFGVSYQYQAPISSILWGRMKWTLLLTIIAVIITFVIAIPIGVKSAANKGKTLDNVLTTFVLALYSLPNFWIASLLILFFCCGDYLCWFPAYGLGDLYADTSIWSRFMDRGYHLILPVLCLVYPSLAFLSRQMRGGMLSELNQDYIKTAKAKGLGEEKILWKHAFRNSLLPVITLFANIFPLAIGGSIVIEYIFNIPGMGLLGLEAVRNLDFPVVYTVMMFAAIFTMAGYLVSDILYSIVDPRITYSAKIES